jgi:acetyltransferase-like isoleucine patch superfamily enzyme
LAISFTLDRAAHWELVQKGVRASSMLGPVVLDERSWFEPPLYIEGFNAGSVLEIGAFSSIASTEVGNVTMGRYCSIGPGVVIGPAEHPTSWLTTSRFAQIADLHGWSSFLAECDCAPFEHNVMPYLESCPLTVIGDDVWVGQGAFIKAGIRIGTGAVIGARSVVTHDVPPFSIVIGSPATVRRMRFADSTIREMWRIAWWRFALPQFGGLAFNEPDLALQKIVRQIEGGTVKPYHPVKVTAADILALSHPPKE